MIIETMNLIFITLHTSGGHEIFVNPSKIVTMQHSGEFTFIKFDYSQNCEELVVKESVEEIREMLESVG